MRRQAARGRVDEILDRVEGHCAVAEAIGGAAAEFAERQQMIDAGGTNSRLNVILCERGVRSFDPQYTRNILDISAIPVLRTLTHLPIMVDPSHGTGKAELVPAMAKAAIAAGADALMIEVHPNPAKALSDGPQSLTPQRYAELMEDINLVSQVFGRFHQPYTFSAGNKITYSQNPAIIA